MFGKCRRRHKTTAKCILVGVTGVGHGVGVTHIALAAADYLSSVLGYKAAFAEVAEQSSIISFLTGETVMNGRNVGYRYKGADYYPSIGIDTVSEILSDRYDIVISDLGVFEAGKRMMAGRCDRVMIIGSMQPWRYDEYRYFMRDHYIKDGSWSGSMYGLYLRKDQKSRFEKEFGVSVAGIPYINDPFRLDREDIDNLSRLTAGWL